MFDTVMKQSNRVAGILLGLAVFCLSPLSSFADELTPLRPGVAADRSVSLVTGSSIDIGNGTYSFSETDLRVPAKGIPITLERTYRSNQIMKGRDDKDWFFAVPLDSPLGYGWYSPWFAHVGGDGSYLDGQGNFTLFERDVNGAFLPDAKTGLTLRWSGNGYELFKRGEGITYLFNSEGVLKQIKDDAGNRVELIYTSGKLTSVKDVMGRTVLTFNYNSRGRVATVTDLAGRSVAYDHDSADNLTKATLTVPGGQTVVLGSYLYDLTDYGSYPMTCSYGTVEKNGVRITTISCVTRNLPPADQFGNITIIKEWWSDGIKYTETSSYTPQYANTYHNLIKKTDPLGNSHTIDYYPKWRSKGIVRSVIDPQGRSTNISHNFTGRTFTYTDYNGRTYKKILNDKGQLLQQTEILGTSEQLITKIDYLDNRITRTTDALGNATQAQTDEWGNTIKRTDADGNEWRYQYDASGRQIMTINPLGITTRYEYDAAGNRTKEILAAGTTDESSTSYSYNNYRELITSTSNGATTGYAYDDGGNLVKITDPLSNQTLMTYDGAGNLLTRTAPLSGQITYAGHDWKGNPQTITDPNGLVTSYSYDLGGRILTSSVGDAVTSYSYTTAFANCATCGSSSSDSGKLAAITLPEGNSISYSYDQNGNLATIADQDGNSIVYSYDRNNNKIKEEIKDPGGVLQKTVSHQYDLLNRQIKTVNPDQGETTIAYDKRGNRITQTNPNTSSTSYSYDQINRLIKVTQPGGGTISYSYDKRNNLTSVTDANNITTSYDYDKQNRLIKTTSPDSGITSYSYDLNGNLKTKTDAKGVTATYSYDTANRLTKIEFPDPKDNVSYSYDSCANGKGRLCSMTDPAGSTSYEYTPKGQVSKETRTIDTNTFVTQYSYDKNGNPTSITYPSGRIISYGYTSDKVTQLLNNGVALASAITYKPFGNITGLTFGNGIQQTNSYDQQYRLTQITTQGIQNLAYSYDKNSNITNIADNLDTTKTKTYGYDSQDRLTTATGPWGSLNYSYDLNGNRTTETKNSSATSYNYKPSTNQLASTAGEKNYSFTFDQNGNTATENTKTYTYNQNQRLIKVAEGAATKGEYLYNGNGQRIKKITNNQTSYFIFDQQGRLIAESGARQIDYVYLRGRTFALIEGSNLYYVHTDHLGTPQKMTDQQKQLTWEISSLPFGETTSITGSAINNLRFPGQYFDQESALHYNYFRDYNPAIGRYIQSDPIGGNQGINHLYVYASDNSVTMTDIRGLLTDSECCQKAFKYGIDEGSTGFPMCCNGREVTCVNIKPIGLESDEANNIISECVHKHEKAHYPDLKPCDKCSLYRRELKDPSRQRGSECVAWKATKQCIIGNYKRCKNNAVCKNDLDFMLEQAESNIAKYCGG